MPSYELQYSGEHATTTAQWVEGCLPEVVSTSAMTPLVESGELPELSREEALEFFAVDPGAAPLTPQLEETINLLDAVLAPGQAGKRGPGPPAGGYPARAERLRRRGR